MVKLLTITWSYENSYNIENTFLYRSFIKQNDKEHFLHIHYNRNEYLELEQEFKLRFDYQYEYILYKLFLTKEKIKFFDTDCFIVADANDVVCLGNVQSLEIPDSVLVSSEINRYPSSMGDWGGLEYSSEEIKNLHFLNSGLFITSKKNYIDFLDSLINNVLSKNLKSFGGDQGIFIFHYLSKNLPQIVLDKEYRLFFNTYSRDHNDYIGYKFPIFLHDNGWNWGSPRFIQKFNLV